MTSSTKLALHASFEDVLDYLPVSGTREYSKGQVIYSPDDPSKGIHLVVSGKVEIWQIAGWDRRATHGKSSAQTNCLASRHKVGAGAGRR